MAAVRAGLLASCMVGAALVALVATGLCRPGGRAARTLGRVFCRVLLRLLRVEVVVSGTPPRGGAGILLVANHVSWLDPLALFAVAPAAMLAKREVGTWPIVTSLARLQATVFVDRARRMQIPAVNRRLADRLAGGRNVLLFPEGTTYDGARRGRFLTSHLACLAGIEDERCAQAVALAYSDPGAAWIGDDTLLPHLWALLRRPPITCRLIFGTPVSVAPGYDRKALARCLAADIEALLTPGERATSTARQVGIREITGLIVTQA